MTPPQHDSPAPARTFRRVAVSSETRDRLGELRDYLLYDSNLPTVVRAPWLAALEELALLYDSYDVAEEVLEP